MIRTQIRLTEHQAATLKRVLTAFIDTSVLYALLSTDTEEHAAARDAFTDLARTDRLATHADVEIETISLVQRRLGMTAIERLVRDILPAIDVETVQPGTPSPRPRRAAALGVSVGLMR